MQGTTLPVRLVSTLDVSKLLRPGLLSGVSMLLAGASTDAPVSGAGAGSFGAAVASACGELGASVRECPLDADQPDAEGAVEASVERALAGAGRVELLVVDGAGLYTAASAGDSADGGHGRAREALRGCLAGSWNVTQAVANRAFLPDGGSGRIVYLAPAADAGVYADAARAGLENLARTLSIEWARYRITTVTIAPGCGADSASELAAVTAYLASPAGAYFSGCLLDLSGARPVLVSRPIGP